MLTPLSAFGATGPAEEEEVDGVASVHARHGFALSAAAAPPGWPRAAADPPVILDATGLGTLHVFDCAAHPLCVRLEGEAEVAGMWSWGAEAEGDVLRRQQAARVEVTAAEEGRQDG